MNALPSVDTRPVSEYGVTFFRGYDGGRVSSALTKSEQLQN